MLCAHVASATASGFLVVTAMRPGAAGSESEALARGARLAGARGYDSNRTQASAAHGARPPAHQAGPTASGPTPPGLKS